MKGRLWALAVAACIGSMASHAAADGEMRARGPVAAPAPQLPSLQSADPETLAIATGHYARTRSLLLAAIREFDEGYRVANPDLIIDSKVFRNTLISRAKELEHILDPQPRVSKSGVRFSPDARLLGGKK